MLHSFEKKIKNYTVIEVIFFFSFAFENYFFTLQNSWDESFIFFFATLKVVYLFEVYICHLTKEKIRFGYGWIFIFNFQYISRWLGAISRDFRKYLEKQFNLCWCTWKTGWCCCLRRLVVALNLFQKKYNQYIYW